MERIGTVTIEEVLPFVRLGPPPHGEKHLGSRPRRVYHGQAVYMDSLRYQTFIKSGTNCVACGLQATYFAVERSGNTTYHLNLYGVTSEGKEILFTKDHIQPISLGGSNHLDNLQTMCAPCNHAKGNGQENRDRKLERARRLCLRIKKQISALNVERKRAYQEGGRGDGGPEYVKLRKRRAILVGRVAKIEKFLGAKREARLQKKREQKKRKIEGR